MEAMHFDLRALRKALAKARLVTWYASTIPALACVRIGEGRLKAARLGGFLDAELETDLPGAEGAAFLVPLRSLQRIVAHAPGDIIRLSHDAEAGRVTIDFADGRASLIALPAGDWPGLPPFETLAQGEGPLQPLVDLLPFVSTEEVRYYLNGVHLRPPREGEAGPAIAEATDGHRLGQLAWEGWTGGAPAGLAPAGIVPGDAVRILPRLFDLKEPTACAFGQAAARFAQKGTTLTVKLIDGSFPDTSRVLPQREGGSCRVMFDRAAMLGKMNRLAAASDYRMRGARIALRGGRLAGAIPAGDGGSLALALPGEAEGEDFDLCLNPGYLASLLRFLGPGEIAWRVDCRLQAAGPLQRFGEPQRFDANGRMAVIMPMRFDQTDAAPELPEGAAA
ncbi:DNA polymerase III holoenzyme [Microcystis phage vB_MweS-yong2]|nr:DNA polymerase III holoenzyme [Microcystis phage vB_MweS-yong2]